MIGARYCSSPRVTIGTRVAAAPKQISGTAVTMPGGHQQQGVAGAVVGEVDPPCHCSQPR